MQGFDYFGTPEEEINENETIIKDPFLAEEKKKAWETIEKDQVVKGIVRRLTDFGAFVDVGGVDGLIHISQISLDKIAKPDDVLNVGDVVRVRVTEVDDEKRKLSLSIKALLLEEQKKADDEAAAAAAAEQAEIDAEMAPYIVKSI